MISSELTKGFTEGYSPKEFEKSKYYNPFLSDVYSTGVMIMKMMGFDYSDFEKKTPHFYQRIKEYPDLFSIVSQMVTLSQRPTFLEILGNIININKCPPNDENYVTKAQKIKIKQVLERKDSFSYETFIKVREMFERNDKNHVKYLINCLKKINIRSFSQFHDAHLLTDTQTERLEISTGPSRTALQVEHNKNGFDTKTGG